MGFSSKTNQFGKIDAIMLISLMTEPIDDSGIIINNELNDIFIHAQVIESSERSKHQKDALILDVYATQFYVLHVLSSCLKDNKHATGRIAAFLQSVERPLA